MEIDTREKSDGGAPVCRYGMRDLHKAYECECYEPRRATGAITCIVCGDRELTYDPGEPEWSECMGACAACKWSGRAF